MKYVTVVLLVLLFASCQSSPKDALIGHTFKLDFYPIAEADPDQKQMADYMNRFDFYVQFVNDSTLAKKSTSGLSKDKWSLTGDSIDLGGLKYFFDHDEMVLVKPTQMVVLTQID